ncbi:hypothetical protein GCM10025857_34750 [Alicyclobacillus contaminans]|uniref:hypothetical protein n=1 Tax=Alicyclobacillus contaminans TaxID=392016 RepID=UPI0003F55EFE|nr:hypothetical protein [Alicyclobacillus contaminans]GMA52118.1 hypothetical protein GCM10025857_34750 [Alicyclobacillus contaminans]
MSEVVRQQAPVPVSPENAGCDLTVDGLLGRLQQLVAETRMCHPEWAECGLYDVSLRLEGGQLTAVLHFQS